MGVIQGAVTTGSFKEYYSFYIEYTSVQNVSANTSTLTMNTMMVKNKASQTAYGNNKSASQTVLGDTRTKTFSYDFRSGQPMSMVVESESYTIAHEVDGTKSVSVSAAANFGTSLLGQAAASGTIVLPAIPRASNFTLSESVDAGASGHVSLSPLLSGATHRADVSFFNSSLSFNLAAGENEKDFGIPLNWLQNIPNAASGTASLTLYTYQGGSLIGSKSAVFIIRAGEEVVPTSGALSLTRIDGSVPSAWGVYVAGRSKARAELLGAAGAEGSAITGYSISGGGFSSSVNPLVTGFLSAGNLSFTARATDSRNRQSGEKTASILVLPYAAPAFSSATADRCDAAGTPDPEGQYFKCKAVFSHSDCGGNNLLSAYVKYRAKGGSYGSAAPISSGTAVVIGGDALITSAYEVSFDIADQFSAVSYVDEVPVAQRIMNVRADGSGLAIGKMSERAGFEVGLDSYVKTPGGLKELFLAVYPVGSVYVSTAAANPGSLFGGTWEAFGAGRVLVGYAAGDGTFGTAGAMGGAKTHTLTIGETPGHTHTLGGFKWNAGGSAPRVPYTLDGKDGFDELTGARGGGSAHNNLQPYVVCYMWKRTA